MAPNMSGVGLVDQARSIHLAELALEFARAWLKQGGDLLVKVFQGEGLDEFRKQLTEAFTSVAVRKPKASRDRSSEFYLLARGRRPRR
jgi:23S rRNA (uridine2552-2'-O)-methyltransferase